MNILFCQHNSICEPGVIRALKHMGHTVCFMDKSFSHPDTDEEYSKLLFHSIRETTYNIVFSINFIPVISKVCEKHHIPYFCWIVDSPVIQLYSDQIQNCCNYIFIFDHTLYLEFFSKNPNHIFYLPLGCDIEWYDSIFVSDEDHQKYDCDISFVGSLYTEKCLYNSIQKQLPDYIQGYFDGILNAQCMVYGYNFLCDLLSPDIMEIVAPLMHISISPGYTIDKKILIGNLLLNPKCAEIERIHLLNTIAAYYPVSLYTESDVSMLKSVHCRGAVSSLEGMPKVFKCSKINLNLTAKGIQSGASLRIFDILGCGGFLISNYQSELPELFEVGKDLILFESKTDLLEKITFYLKNEESRQEIARSGYQKVKKEFSYRRRLELMLHIYSANIKANERCI